LIGSLIAYLAVGLQSIRDLSTPTAPDATVPSGRIPWATYQQVEIADEEG
jgi:hypothetical protein